MPFLQFNPEGVCSLRCAERFDVRIEHLENSDHLFLIAVLANLPDDTADKLALYEHALNQNLINEQLFSACYAVSTDLNALLLIHRIRLDAADAGTFEKLFSTFLQIAVDEFNCLDQYPHGKIIYPDTPPLSGSKYSRI